MLSKYKPHHKLIGALKSKAGRNNSGKITVARRGGGHKKAYRYINFIRHRGKFIVNAIEYDPNRSAYLAQLSESSIRDKNKKIHILASKGLRSLDEITVSDHRHPIINIGDCYPVGVLPAGTIINNIELYPNKGGQLARSAGGYGKILNFHNNNKDVSIMLASGEHRLISAKCKATVGVLSNDQHNNVNSRKAGRSRWLGKRPTVRGVAMNPVDHPHGGGEGKTSGGRPSVTPWARPTKGQPTRSKRKSNKFILAKRKKK